MANVELQHVAVTRRADIDQTLDLAVLLELFDLARLQSQRQQPFRGCGNQTGLLHLQCLQVFLLGTDQRWRVEPEQHLALHHPGAFGMHAQVLDPAFGANVHVAQAVFVGHDARHGGKRARQAAAFGDCGFHADVVDNHRADAQRWLIAARGALLISVDRHQVHIHR